MKGTNDFNQLLIGKLKENQEFRMAYLNEALNEEEGKVALAMFLNVAKALGGMTKLAKSSGLNRQNLYKVLSGEKDPAYSTVEGIVHGFGFKIKVEPMTKIRS